MLLLPSDHILRDAIYYSIVNKVYIPSLQREREIIRVFKIPGQVY